MMPIVQISMRRGMPTAYVANVCDAIHAALVETYEMPADDRFQIVHQLDDNELIFDAHFQGGPRSDRFMLVRITAGRERASVVKAAFMRRAVELLESDAGVRPEDVFILLEILSMSDISFGSGIPATQPQPTCGPESV